MTAKERILAIRLLEKQEHNPEYAKQLGIQVNMVEKEHENRGNKNLKGGN